MIVLCTLVVVYLAMSLGLGGGLGSGLALSVDNTLLAAIVGLVSGTLLSLATLPFWGSSKWARAGGVIVLAAEAITFVGVYLTVAMIASV